jgi:hypothetical protein
VSVGHFIRNTLMQDRAEQVFESAHQPSCLASSYNGQVCHEVDRFRKFPEDEDRDGP